MTRDDTSPTIVSVAAGTHDQTIEYASEVAPAGSVQLECWECWTHRQGAIFYYYAKGPCPGCGATSQGHLRYANSPIESLGIVDIPTSPAPQPVEIAVRCACGFDHGRDGAAGCGRRWSVICPTDSL